ncbi:MAG: hypothetical protein Q8K70_01815 [Bacteroidota bacterium]|nr:hypothetical protein [Bacteroidota bacterium]
MSKDNVLPSKSEISENINNKLKVSKPKKVVEIGSILTSLNNTIDFSSIKTIFYDVIKDKEKKFNKTKINHKNFVNVINQLGFYKYKLETDFIFIHLKNGIIKEVSIDDIQSVFIKYLDSLPNKLKYKEITFDKKYITDEVFEKNATFFSKSKLSLLPASNIVLNKDTKEKAFLYYQNGFVECSSSGYKLLDYKNLKGGIWENQIINRNFTNLNFKQIDISLIQRAVIARFYYLIANSDLERLNSLCSFAGYLMHNFFETDLKALLLTDSSVSDDAEGRTGKGLFVSTLSYVRKVVNIDGKAFKNDDKHKYQNIDLSTQIVHLEDTKPYFNIEDIFNDITGGIKVEPKGKISFNVRAKMVLSCNKTINIKGSSAKGRTIEFELSEHFSDVHTPEMEFSHRFFTEWEKLNEWVNYDNFITLCLSYYLKNGLKPAKEINLSKRKVRDNTCYEFAEWIEEKTFVIDFEYNQKEIHFDFINQYDDIKNDKKKSQLRLFKIWINTWASSKSLKVQSRKSNGEYFIKFLNK